MSDVAPDKTEITKSAVDTGTNSSFAAVSGNIGGGASGTGTASSTPLSQLGGPWYIERQTMDIYYVRVPQQTGGTTTVTLSGAATTNGPMEGTDIIYYARASVQASIVRQTFSTSSSQQPQEFEIQAASGDINGVTYGAINASTMGAMGSIITTTPYIRRTPYTGASSQVEFSKSVECANWAAFRQPVVNTGLFAGLAVSGECVDAFPFRYDLKFHKDAGSRPGTSKDSHTFNFTGGVPISLRPYTDYNIVGSFSTDKESLAAIRAFIDTVGQRMTNQQHYDWPIAEMVQDGFFAGRFPKIGEGLAEYDVNRHA